MTRVLTTIKPLHGPFVPDPAWKLVGRTPLGQQLYEENTPRSRAVPLYKVEPCPDCADAEQPLANVCETCNGSRKVDGDRIWKTNPLNGEPLIAMNRPERYIHRRTFYWESDGHGNGGKIDWTPPTPEEIEALRHEKQVAEMLPTLASALIDAGLSTEDIVERLTAPVTAPVPIARLAPEPIVPRADDALPFDGSQPDGDMPPSATDVDPTQEL